MKQEILISIIIPVYKVEKYLDECIQSVVSQYDEDVEVILVDDGSPDNCGKMCDEYAKKYERIKVIHKENGGVSSARNEGIKKAQGKYVVYLDSDDILCKNVLSILKKDLVQGFDLFAYEMPKMNECGEKIGESKAHFKNGVYLASKYMKEYYKKNNGLPWSASQSIFKREIIVKNNIMFSEKKVAAEDTDFYMKYMINIKNRKMMYSDNSLITYRINRQGSAMTEMKPKAMKDILKVYSKYACSEDLDIREMFANMYVSSLNYIVKSKSKKLLEEVLPEIDSEIICRATGKKQKLIAFCVKAMGLKNVLMLLQKLA